MTDLQTSVAVPSPEVPDAANSASRWRPDGNRLAGSAIVFAFATLFVVLAVASDQFLTTTNLLNILDQSAAVGIIAVAGTLVIIAGGFDLSVGAVFAIAGVLAAEAAGVLPPGIAVVVGMGAGLAIGAINGALSTVVKINSFIATLASSIIVRGLALIITGGFLVNVSDPGFTTLGRGMIGEVSYSVLIWAGFAAFCGILLGRTTFGRYVYASGGNPEAARYSGVPVGRTKALTFALSGFAAGLAGVLVASRVATGQADTGQGLELTAIAAIVVGGTSIKGGEGAVWRTIIGVLFLTLIGNGFNLLSVDPLYQRIVEGCIILTAVGVDALVRGDR